MIHRVVEYTISCDSEDCSHIGGHAYGWQTRDEAIEEAPKYGWVRCTRGRWLCKHCAEKLIPDPLTPTR